MKLVNIAIWKPIMHYFANGSVPNEDKNDAEYYSLFWNLQQKISFKIAFWCLMKLS